MLVPTYLPTHSVIRAGGVARKASVRIKIVSVLVVRHFDLPVVIVKYVF